MRIELFDINFRSDVSWLSVLTIKLPYLEERSALLILNDSGRWMLELLFIRVKSIK